MGKRGPRPAPTALKIMRGNPGKENLKAREKTEPKPADAGLDAPELLTGLALSMWNRRAPQLLALGIFSEVDRETLERYCLIYDLFVEIYRQVKADGASSSTAAGGKKGNPDVGALRGYAADLLAIEREFGMTPSSRTNLVVTSANKEIDPLDEFLRASS